MSSICSCKSDNNSYTNKEEVEKNEDLKTSKTPPKIKKLDERLSSEETFRRASKVVEINSIDYKLIDQLLLDKINKEREMLSLSPFSNDNKLIKAAKIHNDYMVTKSVLEHEEEGTSTPTLMDRIKVVKTSFRTFGENIQYEGFSVRTTNGSHKSILAPTYAVLAESLWNNWKTSPGHYQNLTNPKFKFLGTSLGWCESKTAIFATQVYAGF